MTPHPLDIPDFLRVTPEIAAERAASWRGKRVTRLSKGTGSVTRLQHEDAQTRAFRRELEKQAKAKRIAHNKERRERAALVKKQKVK